jgi:indole-3-glycerol phosphate synthase
MPNLLDQIVAERRKTLAAAQARLPLERVKAAAERRPEGFDRRDFAFALAGPELGVIAELKQASPSRGVLRTDYRPREIAQSYEAAGAVALSVLTEEQYFHGSLTDLVDARDATGIPVLRKDFIVDPYQVYETAAAGADAMLLIVASLGDSDLCRLIELAARLEVAALVEVHNEEEVDRALGAGATILGVNNRDLRTFEVNLETSFRLRPRIPSACLAISESGIGTAADLKRLGEAGFNAALIGERLITAPDPGEELAALLGK